MLPPHSSIPLPHIVLLLLCIIYLYTLQSQQCIAIASTLYNFMYLKEFERRKKSNYILRAFFIQPLYLVLLVYSCVFKLSCGVISLGKVQLCLHPLLGVATSNIHFYISQLQQYNSMPSKCYLKSLREEIKRNMHLYCLLQ